MSNICPVCDTPNDSDAVFCEACGERLLDEDVEEQGEVGDLATDPSDAAEEAAEDYAAEDQFADSDDSEDEFVGEDTGADHEFDAAESEAEEADDEFAGEDTGADHDFADEATGAEELDDASGDEDYADDEFSDEDEAEGGSEDGEFVGEDTGADHEYGEEPADEFDADGDDYEAPAADEDHRAVLYSHVDGQAYYEGSPEFEDGFGPNGEELHPEPPAGYEDEDAGEPAEDPAAAAAAAEAAAATSAAFEAAFQPKQRQRPEMEPLPAPGTLPEPATLTLYVNREPVMVHSIETDETLIGRRDPVADAYPDVDLSEHDYDALVSRKHVYIYRQNRNYTLYVVSHAGTQLNSDLLSLGDRRALSDGDVIVLSGAYAMKFETNA